MTSHTAQALIAASDIDHVMQDLLDHLQEHADVIPHPTGARIESPVGNVDIIYGTPDVQIDIVAPTPDLLALIQSFLAEHVYEFAGRDTAIKWRNAQPDRITPQFQTLTVVDAFDLTPMMRRVLFTCEDVGAFGGNAGYHVTLLLPPQGQVPVWPSPSSNGRLQYPSGKDALQSRAYTIRGIDAANRAVLIDFALHDCAGPASSFAATAKPGDVIGAVGPTGAHVLPADDYLIAGDETALPAISRILGDLPQSARGVVLVEVQNDAEMQELPHPPGIVITWLFRGATPPGASTLLLDAITALSPPLNPDRVFAWIACEAVACRAIRSHLRAGWGLPKKRHIATIYWRRGQAGDGDTQQEPDRNG